MQRAQRLLAVVVVRAGCGDGGVAAAAGDDGKDGGGFGSEVVVVAAVARVRSKGLMMVVRLSVGSARVGFVREREGGWMAGRGVRGGRFREESRVVDRVVEVRFVMRRGRGMRWRSVVVEVEVGVEAVVDWSEGAERLWEMEGRRVIGGLERRFVVETLSDFEGWEVRG